MTEEQLSSFPRLQVVYNCFSPLSTTLTGVYRIFRTLRIQHDAITVGILDNGLV